MANTSSGKDGKGRELICSFCGRSQNEVEQLLIGPGVNICKDCIDMCCRALYKDSVRPAPPLAGRRPRPADALKEKTPSHLSLCSCRLLPL